MLPPHPKQTLSMTTRDGVRLDADVYYPDRAGEFPVLLMRQPYGRSIASTVVYAHPTWYAAQGYIVVIQDVRGRGTSRGKFDLFAHEIEDGVDTVNWVADLPQSNGRVGMYGFSYQGMTQLYAAIGHASALKTICPSMVAYDLYHDWAYEGGAFCYQLNLGWAIQLAAETLRRGGSESAFETLYAASRNLPLQNPVLARSSLLREYAPDSHYHNWLDHPEPDDYWRKLSPSTYLQTVDLPMLHIGGWYDPYLRGTLKLYEAMTDRSQFPQHLIIGPWAHLPWGRKLGAVDYGMEANSPIDRLQLRWFDHFLKEMDTGLLDEPPVCLFEMGSNHWRKFSQFPQGNPKSYYLLTTGLSSISDTEGKLTPAPRLPTPDSRLLTPDSRLPTPHSTLPDSFVHDPWRPVPALGGHATLPAGSFDRTHLDCRTDVVTYTSEPLAQDLHLAGAIDVELHCTADTPSFDLCAILSEVKPDGRVYNITQGYQWIGHRRQSSQQLAELIEGQLDEPDASSAKIPLAVPPNPQLPIPPTAPLPTPHSPTPIALSLQPTCVCIPQGSALRLSISAACFPAYAINSGTSDLPGGCRLVDARVITVTIESEGDRLSRILLPIVE
ncbi:CocE/NonD family hydrolase [Egbenema bharatensis]|uniref:CocE/NonD family hydrolase n=1 Tax=Egbenema bharatensis TaxID=3463334 RepID=UPI003A87E4FB